VPELAPATALMVALTSLICVSWCVVVRTCGGSSGGGRLVGEVIDELRVKAGDKEYSSALQG
jgi:hypothetical protein